MSSPAPKAEAHLNVPSYPKGGHIRTPFGEFQTIRYVSRTDSSTHLALVHGNIRGQSDVLVRVHAHCTYGDVFRSLDCDCHDLIAAALQAIAQAGSGVLIYLHPTGPGIQTIRQEGQLELVTHERSEPTSLVRRRHG